MRPPSPTKQTMLAKTRTSLHLLVSLGAFFTLTFLLFAHQLYNASSRTTALPQEYSHGDPTQLQDDKNTGMDTGMDMSTTHQILRSVSSKDGAYYPIDFGSRRAINPSLIPHPDSEGNDTWIVTAQLHEPRRGDKPRLWFAELVCTAAFSPSEQDTSSTTTETETSGDSSGSSSSRNREVLRCTEPPLILPISATPSDSTKCPPATAFFTLSIGPHDARVFHGPSGPYTIYGSTSQFTCFGQWMLDFRLLVDWGVDTINDHGGVFRAPSELQRPFLTPYRVVEKNWFVFWDVAGKSYVHYDIAPTRAFAELNADGSVGLDLAPQTAEDDDTCLRRLLPAIPETPDPAPPGANSESIHQATNALSITLCERADPGCIPAPGNTFVLTIIQHKSFYRLHSTYEPYMVLFRAVEPFGIYGVSRRPVWISGRRAPSTSSTSSETESEVESEEQQEDGQGEQDRMRAIKLQSEMMYVTSISWKAHGQGYHGYSDDVLFIGFGIEDSATGVIDVRAGDLVDGIELC
ncbi:hypothetical protein BJY00DRAFT_310735 [Aspergillus carlsbadensis]|nr:hypothetical protein BJY00DRAFT_310735 [Aspergillus carlsbadensis]